jgi:hypothetical protein
VEAQLTFAPTLAGDADSGTIPGLSDWLADHPNALDSQRNLLMNTTTQDPPCRDFLADCERIHREWDTHARSLDTDNLIALYAQDAILETPLVPAIFEGRSGVLRGHREIRPFFEEGARRRPNELVRWYRTDNWFTDGKRTLVCSIRGKRPMAIKSSSWKSRKSSMV